MPYQPEMDCRSRSRGWKVAESRSHVVTWRPISAMCGKHCETANGMVWPSVRDVPSATIVDRRSRSRTQELRCGTVVGLSLSTISIVAMGGRLINPLIS